MPVCTGLWHRLCHLKQAGLSTTEVAALPVEHYQIQFREGKIAHEHLYWDQTSVLVQLGLVDEKTLPVAGVASARRLDPSVSLNRLLCRGHGTG